MVTHSIRRFCLSALLLCVMFLQVAPAQVVSSQRTDWQTGDPPTQKVVPTDNSLEKLSADLRQQVQKESPVAAGLMLDQASGDPLMVSALIQPGAEVQRFFTASVVSREVAGLQWVTGELDVSQLRKLASVPEVIHVISTETYQAIDAPGLDELREGYPQLSIKEMHSLLAKGGQGLLQQRLDELKKQSSVQPQAAELSLASESSSTTSDGAGSAIDSTAVSSAPSILDIHGVRAVSETYKGTGVKVAVVDTGVDFAHPDLKGTQATIPSGPYQGWPFAYDVSSAAAYALNPSNSVGPDNVWMSLGLTNYVHTLPVPTAGLNCAASLCDANLVVTDAGAAQTIMHFSWPNTSKSGKYLYSIHPDRNLTISFYYMGKSYPDGPLTQPALIVSDEAQPGVYDTVYADINFNHFIGDSGEEMTRNQPISSVDLNQDGVVDVSGGMLGWISDGLHQPPGVTMLYPSVANYPIPGAGRLLTFINDQESHGTNCASEIAGQGQLTDPKGIGPSNGYFAGAADKGGVGGAVIPSMAPEAKIAAFQNGFDLPLDAWTLAVLGFDGQANTGDEVNIVSNSWGDSDVIADGWDPVSRFAQKLALNEAEKITFLVATGNGGHGYGTVTAPGGGSIIDVGASTAYGSLRAFEFVKPDQFLYGEVQPWSDRGPGALGDIAPDIVAVGAWGTGANPLNIYYGNGQQAYDVFGGTSMATPVAAGNLALIYEAYEKAHGTWPTWEEARNLLLGTAQDLGYDVLVQGAGNVRVDRAIAAATGSAAQVSPVQWQVGSIYPNYPGLISPGGEDTQVFSIDNPTTQTVTANLRSEVYQRSSERTYSFAYSPQDLRSTQKLPIFLQDLSDLIDTSSPDLVRAQVILPYNTFDVNRDGYPENAWSVYLYDWLDRDHDNQLWQDTNQDGMVEQGEMEVDPDTGLYEFNRFTYGYPVATNLEASLGKQGLEQRHDGVFLGLTCSYCGYSTTLQVRVTTYKKVPWDWMTLPAEPLTVGPASTGNFNATIKVPADTKPGVYEGAVVVNIGGVDSVLPVIVNAAASSATFQYGGSENVSTPYDNGRMLGGFNWSWRYESGDWRFFYYDLPEGSGGPGKTMVFDTRWYDPDTDIDTWAFGPAENTNPQLPVDTFGPKGLKLIGGSQDLNTSYGKFTWNTATGYSRELFSTPINNGLGMLALHNVLYGGSMFSEGFNGQAYQVSTVPAEVNLVVMPNSLDKPTVAGMQEVNLTSTADITEGLSVQAYGLSSPINLTDQTAHQNGNYNLCASTWVYRADKEGLEILHGGLLEVDLTSKDTTTMPNLDLDLYVLKDDGDGKLNCAKDPMVASSAGAYTDEKVKIMYPEDGNYWIVVFGSTVPRGTASFDLKIRAVQGTGLTVAYPSLPDGMVKAGVPVELNTSFRGTFPLTGSSELEGLLLVGPPVASALIEIPIHVRPAVLLNPKPTLSVTSRLIKQSPVQFALTFQNAGVSTETVKAQVTLPAGLSYVTGSAEAPGTLMFDDQSTNPAARTLTWQGPLAGGTKATVTFRAVAQADSPAGTITVPATVEGETSHQKWDLSTQVDLNMFIVLMPFIKH